MNQRFEYELVRGAAATVAPTAMPCKRMNAGRRLWRRNETESLAKI